MKLTAKVVPHSSIVGGGLMLCDEKGRARFIVNFMGTTEGIKRGETEALTSQFASFVEQHGLTVPDREDKASPRFLGRCPSCKNDVYSGAVCVHQNNPECLVALDRRQIRSA